jgi:hypothetical protein
VARRFDAFIPDFHTTDGFPIHGGTGYVVIAERDTTVIFAGSGWLGEQPQPPPLPLARGPDAGQRSVGTAVLGLFGRAYQQVRDGSVPLAIDGHLSITNRRSRAETVGRLNPTNGHFSTAFVDFTNAAPTVAGDSLTIRFRRLDGDFLGQPHAYVIGHDDVQRGFANLGQLIMAVPPAVTLAEQNFPNPFNPITRIRYQLASPGQVSLKIYAVDGRLVRTLVDDRIEAGYYEAIWSGRNNGGSPVASGIYFYRFEAPGYENRFKMLLLK